MLLWVDILPTMELYSWIHATIQLTHQSQQPLLIPAYPSIHYMECIDPGNLKHITIYNLTVVYRLLTAFTAMERPAHKGELQYM